MPESSKHILSTFEAELGTLRNKLLWMASLTEKIVQTAFSECFFKAQTQSCSTTINDDEEIDQLEKEIDQCGLDILLRFTPVATDLRQVISSMRISQNLERIADHAVGIARKANKLTGVPRAEEVSLLEPMYKEVSLLLKDAITAFSDKDAALALTLKERDKAIDGLNTQATEHLTQLMSQHPEKVVVYLNLVFIARHLERIADLAKYIGADAVFSASAVDIRHVHAPKA